MKTIIVDRTYKCSRCQSVLLYKEKCSRAFRKRCPICNKNFLLLESATSNVSLIFDLNKCRTFGKQSDLNIKNREKEFGKTKKDKPFWRKKDKINFKILNNPSRYITEGKI